MRSAVFLLLAVATVFCLSAMPVEAADGLNSDIELTIRHMDGKTETFGKELAELQIVVGNGGVIQYLHLVLVMGREKDTHAWYVVDNIASFQYRFFAITGKGKVKLKRLDEFSVKAKEGLPDKIDLQEVDDFK